ncbi:MAG: ABC transporter permease [Clostridia bacterium]|nr:ABC transporter permease [Clostridia bacterium]
MLIWENILLALSGLKANKMRAFLTMLGIIIGIGSVITIMTLGESVTDSFTSSMQSLGANNVTVAIQPKQDEEEQDGGMYFMAMNSTAFPQDKDYITDEMVAALRESYGDEMLGISISESAGDGRAEDGKLYANVSVTGVNADYFLAGEPEILAGRMLTESELSGDRRLAVVSDKLVNNMFGGDMEKAVGSTIEVTTGDSFYSYTIVGVYKYEMSIYNMHFGAEKDIRSTMYIPIGAARAATHSTAGYSSITAITAPGVDSTRFASRVERFLNAYYRNNRDYEVNAFSMESMVSEFTSVLGTIETAISVIAGISLLVGGIGVMNIMLVSITERTREIGTCKALGATNGSIRLQFIIEAVIICLIGGALGVALGVTAGSLASKALGFPAAASIKSIVIALLFSMSIGVFFGYYPANKAANMDPINALRYE